MGGRKIDMVGRKCGRLLVLEEYPVKDSPRTWWRCRCECGVEVAVKGASLRNGHTRSCGCLAHEVAVQMGHQNGAQNLRGWRAKKRSE